MISYALAHKRLDSLKIRAVKLLAQCEMKISSIQSSKTSFLHHHLTHPQGIFKITIEQFLTTVQK